MGVSYFMHKLPLTQEHLIYTTCTCCMFSKLSYKMHRWMVEKLGVLGVAT